ncbi:NANO3 protein, partial [Pygoscelis papua]
PAFDMWRDYLGLAAVLATLPQERSKAGEGKAGEGKAGEGEAGEGKAGKGEAGEGEAAASASAPEASSVSPGKSLCAFCKHNGEAKHIYSGHSLRDARGRVQCPVLRSYVCPQCGATQDRAHTKRFCPLTHRGYTSIYSHVTRNSSGKRAVG